MLQKHPDWVWPESAFESALSLGWVCSESILSMDWVWIEYAFESALSLFWVNSESGLSLGWVWIEYGLSLAWVCSDSSLNVVCLSWVCLSEPESFLSLEYVRFISKWIFYIKLKTFWLYILFFHSVTRSFQAWAKMEINKILSMSKISFYISWVPWISKHMAFYKFSVNIEKYMKFEKF